MWDIAVRVFAALSMVGLAVALAFCVRRRYPSWKPYRWGALCFILSQVFHIPFNALVLNPCFVALGWNMSEERGLPLLLMSLALGLSAGVFEETSRWFLYRTKFCNDQSYELALLMGAGHGGCEAILAGWFALMTLVGMAYLRAHPEALPSDDQAETVKKVLTDYWAASAFVVLLAPVERIFAMTFHLSASVLVWQSFAQNSAWYFVAAVAFHAALDTTAVYLLISKGIIAVELVLLLTAFPLSLYILNYYRRRNQSTQANDEGVSSEAARELALPTATEEGAVLMNASDDDTDLEQTPLA